MKHVFFIVILFLTKLSFCQDKNFLFFHLVDKIDKKPIGFASVHLSDSSTKTLTTNTSDSLGVVYINLNWIKGDSANLFLRVAADTITTFRVYKNRVYNYTMYFEVDLNCISWRYKQAEIQSRKRKKRN